MTRNLSTMTPTIAVIAVSAAYADAGLPHAHTWPMEHISVSMDETNTLHAHVNNDANNPVEMLRFPGETYDGNASSLNDMYYSDQYGWALDGIVDPGAGNSIWIELVSQSEGLETYEGGMRMMIDAQTFNPIFGTDGSDTAWQWSGVMTHNWYAAAELGDYEATYRVYVGDSTGAAVAGFTETQVTIYLRAVPTPGALATLGLGTLLISRRKRG